MGRKAKLKKARQQQKTSEKASNKYNSTQFVKQFERMGYQVKVDPKSQPKTNRGNISPEIPQDRVKPQL